MAKIVLDTITGGYDLSVINNNFDKIEAEFQNKVLYRDNPVGEANTFQTDIDANGKKIYNLPEPLLDSQAARLQDVQNAIAGGAANLIPFTPYGNIAAINLQAALQEEIDDLGNTNTGTSLIGVDGTTLSTFLKDRNNKVVNSITELKAVDKTKFTRAFVTGYYTAGDGGGGVYWFDSTDTTSVDNGGTIIVATDGGRWKLIYTGLVSIKQFGAKGDGTTSDTAAIQAALDAVKLVFAPRGNYKSTGIITLSASGGIVGEGELTKFIRFFTGGQLIRHPGGNQLGDPIILRDFSITTDASITVASTDTGIDIGYASAWAGRGEIANLIILKQWNGFKWKGGTAGPMVNIQCHENKGSGFVGINPRGELIDCLAQFNEAHGYSLFADTNGETGVRLIHCGTFVNQEFGLILDAGVGISSANVWLDKFSSSFDGRGGIFCEKTYSQLQWTDTFIEYAGHSQTFKPAFTSYPSATGIVLGAGVTHSQLSGITTVSHCKGAGVSLQNTTDVTIQELICWDNGLGLQGGSNQNGLNINNTNTRLIIRGFSRGTGGASQTTDIAINAADNTGELTNARAVNIFSVAQTGFAILGPVRGAATPSVASASSVTLPSHGRIIDITGTTQIDSIAASWNEREVILKFASTVTVVDGNNHRLNGIFSSTADDTLTLICDGTNWYEVARSAN